MNTQQIIETAEKLIHTYNRYQIVLDKRVTGKTLRYRW